MLCAVLYVTRMFCITAGYHRYFSHRSYKMGRVAQFLMAFGGTTAIQKGPLWWASHHRIHHRFTDLDGDVHSPRDGFWWSHVGWILSTKYKDTDLDGIKDFATFPELRLVERFQWVGPWALGDRLLRGRWVGRPVHRLLPLDGPAVARHVPGQLDGPHGGPAPLRHPGHQPELPGHRRGHRRRGVAQQPPLPAGLGAPGLPLVGVRSDLVRAPRVWPPSTSSGTCKNPPARLLDQARVRDGAFDIGMFRSYWERAAKITGERIADLSARPTARRRPKVRHPAAASQCGPCAGQLRRPRHQHRISSCAAGITDEEQLSALAGLITRALESADQLAATTRRARKGTKAEAAGTTAPRRIRRADRPGRSR